jgi:hypothetical protein
MGVISRHFLRQTSPEMNFRLQNSGTERHRRKRESGTLVLFALEVERILQMRQPR